MLESGTYDKDVVEHKLEEMLVDSEVKPKLAAEVASQIVHDVLEGEIFQFIDVGMIQKANDDQVSIEPFDEDKWQQLATRSTSGSTTMCHGAPIQGSEVEFRSDDSGFESLELKFEASIAKMPVTLEQEASIRFLMRGGYDRRDAQIAIGSAHRAFENTNEL